VKLTIQILQPRVEPLMRSTSQRRPRCHPRPSNYSEVHQGLQRLRLTSRLGTRALKPGATLVVRTTKKRTSCRASPLQPSRCSGIPLAAALMITLRCQKCDHSRPLKMAVLKTPGLHLPHSQIWQRPMAARRLVPNNPTGPATRRPCRPGDGLRCN
jgi:hypothetical protein